jgi:8-oxo-dGTP diphosphatase
MGLIRGLGKTHAELGRHLPLVGLGVLIDNGEAFLMERRKGSHGAGTWSVPGGHLDHGETWAAGARREVVEETGMGVHVFAEPVGVTQCTVEDLHYITLFLYARPLSHNPAPEIREPDKCAELRWVRWEDMGGLDLFDPLFAFRALCPHRPTARI